ncbi:MAG: hypothetical protein ABJA37_09575 [Ferruginibacter sp.]
MKKHILSAAALLIVVISCKQNKNNIAAVKADTTQTVSTSQVESKNETDIAIPSLSPQELKDDSVFTDGSIPTSWENAGITDEKGFKLFLKQLQLWVADNDKEKLATAIKYPLKNIHSAEELVAAYDAVFTKKVKLSFATINFNQIFRNAQGAMTESGLVWFAQQGKGFKIIAVNN